MSVGFNNENSDLSLVCLVFPTIFLHVFIFIAFFFAFSGPQQTEILKPSFEMLRSAALQEMPWI